ncbi:MAG: hypothetical protein ACI82F_003319 [Planctomycetota bacterium]|jgi:hypothetical protein
MSTPRDPRRPGSAEYDAYYTTYVDQVPDGDVVDFMSEQLEEALALFGDLPADKANFRYAPDKWSTKELIGHILDTEWVFTYRALRFARGDRTALAGMDQNALIAGSNFGDRGLRSLVDEFRNVRSANLILFDSFDEEIMVRAGLASGCHFTVRSMLFVQAGHVQHHLEVLRERYL